MFKEEIMDKYFSNKHTKNVPILFEHECLTAIEQVLEEIKEENLYVTVSELFE